MTGNASDADHPILAPRKAPKIGRYVSVSKVSETIYTFQMPNTDVEVRGTFHEALLFFDDIVESGNTSQPTGEVMIRADMTVENTISYMVMSFIQLFPKTTK